MADEELQDVSLTLSPLLSDDKQKSAEYRVRSNAYEFKSVHPADAEVEVANGWETHKLRKRSTLLKRAKSHDRALEDRIWCVLYRMGYPELSGSQFEISFKRSTGAHGHKQIDVFATDVATAFVVECKSKLDRGRRALQKDLSETHALQKYIRQTIRRHVGVTLNPKVIWVYATQNIIWSEADLALQLRFPFDMGLLSYGLMGSSPDRPGDDMSGMDAALGQSHGNPPDLLHRPADQSAP